MANEAVIIELSGQRPKRFTCANATGIEKGTLLKLTDPRTVAATTAEADIFAGIAAEEKVASDGRTSIAVYVPGQGNIFDLKCGAAAVTAGAALRISGANLVGDAVAADLLTGKAFGKALETGSANEVIAVLV